MPPGVPAVEQWAHAVVAFEGPQHPHGSIIRVGQAVLCVGIVEDVHLLELLGLNKEGAVLEGEGCIERIEVAVRGIGIAREVDAVLSVCCVIESAPVFVDPRVETQGLGIAELPFRVEILEAQIEVRGEHHRQLAGGVPLRS